MVFPKKYKVLNQQTFSKGNFSLVPIRFEDRINIMEWRNEQIYHLRQDKPLTLENQENYFNNIVSKLFDQVQPNQILFSFLENGECIGYGGLVHINWIDRNAEISFIMQTKLEKERFSEIWCEYLCLLKQAAFKDLNLQKIFTYAFDVRPHLYSPLLKSGFYEEARLKEHCFFDNKYIDVLIHSKINDQMTLKVAVEEDVNVTFEWASNSNVRQYSIQKDAITFENHKKWFLNKIKSSNCVYFIAKVKNNSVGSIRFDINDQNEALISFLLDPEFHGRGYGKILLEMGCKQLLEIEAPSKIMAVVHVDNIASIRIFNSLGFNSVGEINSFISFEK